MPVNSQRTLITGGFVLSMDPQVGDLPAGDVLIEDGRIAAIAPSNDADAERVDAAGTIVLPGFVDTHRHLWNTTLRGYLPDCTVPLYGAKVLGAVGSVIRPEDTEIGELLGALDLLDSDFTPSLTARDVLEFATVDGAAALGLDGKTGSLTVGKQADIIMIAAGQVNTIPMTDPVGTVVTQAGRGNVDSVFVAGRPVKRHGALLGTDLAWLRSRAEDLRDYILGRTRQLPAWLPSPAPR